MRFYVGLTDDEWFDYLSQLKPDEVNFWRPSSHLSFQALQPGAPFLFKLHAPHHAIVGGGFFVRFIRLPLSIAWLTFSSKNGAPEREIFFEKVLSYRRERGELSRDPIIGNIILAQPFFFEQREWLLPPSNWAPSIQQGKVYDTDEPIGAELWAEVMRRLQAKNSLQTLAPVPQDPQGSYRWTFQRLGQGAFRALVIDAYRQCAVTFEHTLPVLEAAHIRPYAQGGPHTVNNGLLLRSDLHILFDRGYVSVDEDYRFIVSEQLAADYHNGRNYYTHNKQRIFLPNDPSDRPSREFLQWHREKVFLG